jgi:hypothetical protein
MYPNTCKHTQTKHNPPSLHVRHVRRSTNVILATLSTLPRNPIRHPDSHCLRDTDTPILFTRSTMTGRPLLRPVRGGAYAARSELHTDVAKLRSCIPMCAQPESGTQLTELWLPRAVARCARYHRDNLSKRWMDNHSYRCSSKTQPRAGGLPRAQSVGSNQNTYHFRQTRSSGTECTVMAERWRALHRQGDGRTHRKHSMLATKNGTITCGHPLENQNRCTPGWVAPRLLPYPRDKQPTLTGDR